MSIVQLTGFAEAQAILEKMPFELREKYLKKAVQTATDRVAQLAASYVPESKTQYLTPAQRKRPRLKWRVGQRVKIYSATVVGVGGPYSSARHGHLVEKGFYHTTGGTFTGSGGYSERLNEQWTGEKGSKRRAAGVYRAKARYAKKNGVINQARTGTGKRGNFVEGRPYLGPAFRESEGFINDYIVTALREFAAEVSNG